VAEDKLILVRNGLPRRAPEADPVSIEWPRGSRRLLFVGRFDRQKGIDILFDALRELGDDAFAIIAGDSLRVSLGALPKNARYAGWLTPAQLEAYYRSAEVVVMPSRWEGFGLVAVEAMRAGLPVIASSVGGLTEIIEDGKTGVLVKPNDVAALVAALRGLDEQSLRVMGDAAYKRFLANFTIDDAFRSLCDLYHRFEQKSAITEELNDLTAR
jgi:glycosyltransferase involved in cell wall biosynthesis